MKWHPGFGVLLAGALLVAPEAAHANPAQQRALVGQVEGRPVAPGWVGLKFKEVRSGEGSRVVISSVYPGSPAEGAGLEAGDRVLRLNGVTASFPIIQSLSSRIEPGDPWAFTIGRQDEVIEIPVVAVPRPPHSEIVMGTLQSQLDSLRIRIEMQLDTLNVAGLAGLPTLRVHRETGPGLDENTVRFVVTANGASDEVMAMAEQAMLVGPAFAAEAERVFAFRVDEAESLRAAGAGSGATTLSVRAAPEAEGARTFRDITAVWSGSAPFSPYPTGADRAAGAQFRRVVPDLGRYLGVSRGLLIVDLDAGTPAARSGLRTGDVILAVDGETVETLADFRSLISLPAPSYDLEVARRGERMRLALRH